MKKDKLNILQKIWLEVLWIIVRIFALLPHWFKYYVVENFIFVILYYCLRYRIKVVRMNLRKSFPEKSEAEIRKICKKYYYTLSEMIVDTLNTAFMTERKAKHLLVVDEEEAKKQAQLTKNQDWIALTAHFGCWEYATYWGFYDKTKVVMGVYHPLHSKVTEKLFERMRDVEVATTVPMHDSLRFFLRHRGKEKKGRNYVLGLIADQNPPKRPDSHWFNFLNQETIFFDGGEKLAMRCHLPVYFVKMERIQRGRYRMSFKEIYDGLSEIAPNEITERYVRNLEEMIRETPELWLWSHRRWKHKRTNAKN